MYEDINLPSNVEIIEEEPKFDLNNPPDPNTREWLEGVGKIIIRGIPETFWNRLWDISGSPLVIRFENNMHPEIKVAGPYWTAGKDKSTVTIWLTYPDPK